ncbi:MAG: NUDIX hydrolase [Thermoguttaceae bacterium]
MNPEDRKAVLGEGRFLRLVRQDGWEWAERIHSRGVVAIVAVTGQGEIVLAEQYRRPLEARVVDLPMGLAGDQGGSEDEDFEDAARRELLEETGYEAERFEALGEGPTSPGLTTEIVTWFLALGCRKVADGGGDGTEDITVHAVPLDQADAWLERKRAEGVLVDPKIYGAMYLARRETARGGWGTVKE